MQACRPRGAMVPPDFRRSGNPISISGGRGGQIIPPHHHWHPRIFRPSYGPVKNGAGLQNEYRSFEKWNPMVLFSFPFKFRRVLFKRGEFYLLPPVKNQNSQICWPRACTCGLIRLFLSTCCSSSAAISQFTSSDWKYFPFPNWNIFLFLIRIVSFL